MHDNFSFDKAPWWGNTTFSPCSGNRYKDFCKRLGSMEMSQIKWIKWNEKLMDRLKVGDGYEEWFIEEKCKKRRRKRMLFERNVNFNKT